MVINCFYDEDMKYADIIYVPSSIPCDLDLLQDKFFKWMFDKHNDHKYWIIANGKKLLCRYGTDAFVDWINNEYFINSSDVAYIIEKNAIKWNADKKNLFF